MAINFFCLYSLFVSFNKFYLMSIHHVHGVT